VRATSQRSLGSGPVRESSTEITIFKSLGMAVEDVVAAKLVFYDRARGAGIGREFEF